MHDSPQLHGAASAMLAAPAGTSSPAVTDAAPHVALLCCTRWTESLLRDALRADGVVVSCCADVLALIALLRSTAIDVVVVEDTGLHFAGSLMAMRFRGAATMPVLAAGAGSARQITEALRHGACDYASLTDTLDSLVNRVRARAQLGRERVAPAELQVGCCVLDEPSRTLRHPRGHLQLTSREFGLAWVLFQHAGQVVNLHALSQQVWGRDSSVAKRTIEQHVCRLRAKLMVACAGAQELLSLQAIHNVGYRMVLQRRSAGLAAQAA